MYSDHWETGATDHVVVQVFKDIDIEILVVKMLTEEKIKELKILAESVFHWAVMKRRQLHQIPENGFEEHKTQRIICDTLNELNIPFECNQTWVIGLLGSGNRGNTVALRADMDALPIRENTGLPFSSVHNGWMHACGHDMHMAIQLGCAKVLTQCLQNWSGNVKFLFQPAEETVGGALPMVEAGALRNPDVAWCYGLHVQPYLAVGDFETKSGTLNASTDDIVLTINGKAGHGAYPDRCSDAIVCAAQILCGLQTLISRNVSPLIPAVLTFGTINGGCAPNIVCDRVILRGTLRTAESDTRIRIKTQIQKTTEGIASAMNCNATIEIADGYAPLVNTEPETEEVFGLAEQMLGRGHVTRKETPSMGGEDFSYFTQVVPGTFYHIGCTPKGKLPGEPLHSASFCPDEEAIYYGVLMQAGIVLEKLGIDCQL